MKNQKTITCDVDLSTREITPEGFLKVKVLAGRVGVQTYTTDELGVEDIHGNGLVNVARLPDDVFSQRSLDSMEFKDITDNHPPEREVTADNYRSRTVGVMTSKGIRANDGIHVQVDALIKDRTSIKRINDKNEVSLGYEHDIVRRSGTLDGVNYDFVQQDIIYNHLAIVHRGRAKTTRILDGDNSMTKEEELKKRVAELEEQNKKLSNDADAAETALVIEKAKIIDSSFDCSGKTSEQIKRGLLGSRVTADHALNVVDYAFDDLYSQAKTKAPERTHKPLNISIDNEPDDETEKKRIANDAAAAKAEYLKGLEEGY